MGCGRRDDEFLHGGRDGVGGRLNAIFFPSIDMESHEILREAFQQTSPKEIAAEMGLSLSLVYKWAQPGEGKGSGVDNPLDRVIQLVRLTQNPRLLEWLCQKAGGYYVRNPSYQGCDDEPDVFPATNEIIQEFADLLESITTAAGDRTISVRESEKIRQQWDELKAFTEGFVRCCEEGNFDKPPALMGRRV